MDGILLSDGSIAVLFFAVVRMWSKVIYDGAFGSKSPFGNADKNAQDFVACI